MFLTELGVVDGAFVVVRNVVWLPPTCTDRVVLHTCVAVVRVAVIDATQRMKEESPFVASSHFLASGRCLFSSIQFTSLTVTRVFTHSYTYLSPARVNLPPLAGMLGRINMDVSNITLAPTTDIG